MKIIAGDLDDPRILALLAAHLEAAKAHTPICSVHALDASHLRAPGIEFLALWNGEDLLGVGALKELSPEHGEIKSMHVAETKRRSGAGRTLLGHIVAEARAKGMKRLSLETGCSDYFRAARALYRAHGFFDCAPFGGYGPDPNSIFMSREL